MIKDELKFIFANISDLLKFAEAKHGGLLVLNSGVILGVLTSYSNLQKYLFKELVIVGILGLALSAFFSMLSQYPNTHKTFYSSKNILAPNLYFFGDLCHLDYQTFENALVQNGFMPDAFDKDLMNQILVISRIASTKFLLYKFAVYASTFGGGVIVLSTLLKLFL